MNTGCSCHLTTFLHNTCLARELQPGFADCEQAPVLRSEVGAVEAGERSEISTQAEATTEHDVSVRYPSWQIIEL